MIRLHQIITSLDQRKNLEVLKQACMERLHIKESELLEMRIYRESIDARKNPIRFSYIIDVAVKDEQRCLRWKGVERAPDLSYSMPIKGKQQGDGRIIVAGFGPAGMFLC